MFYCKFQPAHRGERKLVQLTAHSHGKVDLERETGKGQET